MDATALKPSRRGERKIKMLLQNTARTWGVYFANTWHIFVRDTALFKQM